MTISVEYETLDAPSSLQTLSAADQLAIRALRQFRRMEMTSRIHAYQSRGRHLVTLVTCMKDESPDDILEWIAYHRLQGVGGFIVMDNDSTGNMPLFLEALHESGIICHVAWPTVSPFERQQMTAFASALQVIQSTGLSEWIALLDVDEFIVSRTHQDLTRALAAFDAAGADAVHMPWLFFGSGSAELKEPGLVTTRFTKRARFTHGKNSIGKPLARTAAVEGCHSNPHALKISGSYILSSGAEFPKENPNNIRESTYAQARVNSMRVLCVHHYAVKSRQEFSEKRSRGRINYAANDPRALIEEEYWRTHDINEEEDLTLADQADSILEEMRRITPGIS